MKPICWGIFVAVLLAWSSFGQDGAETVRNQSLQEDLKRLRAANETLMDNQTLLQKRLELIMEKVSTLEERLARSTNNMVSREELRKAFDRLSQEIEQKGKEDKQAIQNSMNELRKLIKAAPVSVPPPVVEPKETTEREGYQYEVKEGDSLGAIIKAYNEKFKSEGKKRVTQNEVLRANPGLNPERLRPGRTIIIPKPTEK